MIELQIIITNKFGEFKGEKFKVTEEQRKEIYTKSKDFYLSDGFELTCEDGSFVIFPGDIVKDSMLTIKQIINI